MARNGRAHFGVLGSVQGPLRDQGGCMLKILLKRQLGGVWTLRECLLRLVDGRDRGNRPKLEGDVPEKE